MLIEVFHKLYLRALSPQILIFPSTYNWYLTPSDRTLKRNVDRIRQFVKKVVDKRKAAMKKSDYVESNDLLTILL